MESRLPSAEDLPQVLVLKFGGTSLGDRGRIDTVVRLIRARLDRQPVVVCSAHGGVTDLLLEGARAASEGRPDLRAIEDRERGLLTDLNLNPRLVDAELDQLGRMFEGLKLLGELTPRSLDRVAAFGERMSVKTVAALLRRRRIPATAVPADEAGLVTDSKHTRATPLDEAYPNLRTAISKVEGVPVVTGFIGQDAEGHVTTLGRSGSDFTATILARALGAEEVQIWTDVSGVLTADPRLVPDARPVEYLSYAEASELAYYGARVIHPATIQPAVEKRIPVRILNTLDPEAPGTVIAPYRRRRGSAVKSIASKGGIHLVNIVSGRMLGQSGFMATVFEAFRNHDVVVDLVATSEVSVTVSVDRREGLNRVVSELRRVAKVHLETGNALVAVVGERMREATDLPGRVFQAVGDEGVRLRGISYGATQTNLQLVVPESSVGDTVRALHRALFPGTAAA